MTALDEKYIDGNIPGPYQYVQALLDRFVAVGYETLYNALRLHPDPDNANYLRGQIVAILRDNPPLVTIPKYFRDGRENYLWYSDFYDDAGKEVFRKYGQLSTPLINITPANYAEELGKIELPYFVGLVNLVSLEKLYLETGKRISVRPQKDIEPVAAPEQPKKNSYEPKLNGEQYSLLAECIEGIKLFRRPLPVAELKRLLKGKLTEPLEVANQSSLTFLFDRLGEGGLIRDKWIAVAVGNKDFLSFRRGKNKVRYGDEPHYISMQQFSNCRRNNNITGFKDLIPIEEAIEKILAIRS